MNPITNLNGLIKHFLCTVGHLLRGFCRILNILWWNKISLPTQSLVIVPKGNFLEYKKKIAGSKLQKSPGVYFVSDGGDDVIGEDAADVGVRSESFSSLLCKHHCYAMVFSYLKALMSTNCLSIPNSWC